MAKSFILDCVGYTLPTFTENQSHEALDEYNGNVW